MTSPYKLFSKPELQEVADELGIKYNDNTTTQQLVKLIHGDLTSTGIPDENDCSDLLDNYLFNCGYIDEDGDVLENVQIDFGEGWKEFDEVISDKEDAYKEPVVQITDIFVIIDGNEHKKPDCFSMADNRDPSCRRCVVVDQCMIQRVSQRPSCYGNVALYDPNNEECRGCLEFQPCGQLIKERRN